MDHGVEPRSSGVHVDAGHQTALAPFRKAVVGIANIVQEVKTGTNSQTQDLNSLVQLTERIRYRAHPSRCGWNGFAPGRVLTSAVSC